jgi:hypothetical protein
MKHVHEDFHFLILRHIPGHHHTEMKCFTAMSTVVLPVAIIGATSLLPHATKNVLKFSFQWCKFHSYMLFSFC